MPTPNSKHLAKPRIAELIGFSKVVAVNLAARMREVGPGRP